jgi:hypothetical protein
VNPKPSLIQALTLHDIADDGVWFDIVSGRWHSTHVRNDVTVQVDILHRDGYVTIVSTGPDSSIQLTDKGREVLARRPLGELLERINSR